MSIDGVDTDLVRSGYVGQQYLSRFPNQRDYDEEASRGTEFDLWLLGEKNKITPDLEGLLKVWEKEENMHRQTAEYGIAEGLRIAQEDLRAAMVRAGVL